MAWSVIRKATQEDTEKLEARAKAFAQRHGIEVDEEFLTAVESVEYAIDDDRGELKGAWKKVNQRALGSKDAEGIAYGHVGFTVK